MIGHAPDARLTSPAADRNKDAILAVLARVLPPEGLVVEVASGTGQHAVHFAARLPTIRFQPTESDPTALASIAAWARAAGAPANLLAPVALDAAAETWPVAAAEAVLCCNMIHIAPWDACRGLMRGAARLLGPGGMLVLYGPYKIGGRHTAPSNEAFDRSLRMQDPAWGVRDLETVIAEAEANGFVHVETVAMPANNQTVIFRKA